MNATHRASLIALLLSTGMAGAQTVAVPTDAARARAGSADAAAGDEGADAAQREDPITLGLRTGLTLTNRGRLDADGTRHAGQILEVSPYARIRSTNTDRMLYLDYMLRNFARYPGAQTDLARHSLVGTGDLALAGEALRLYGRAQVTDVIRSPFAVQSADPSLSGVNRARTQIYELAPYLTGRWGDEADYELRYSAGYTDYGTSPLSVTANRFGARLRVEPEPGQLGGIGRFTAARYQYSNDLELRRDDVQLGAVTKLGWDLLAGVTANHVNSPQIRTPDGKTSGWGPGALLEWVPAKDASLLASGERNYFGSSYSMRALQTSGRLTGMVRADRALLVNSATAMLNYDSATLLSGFRDTGAGAGDPLSKGSGGVLPPYASPLAAGTVQGLVVWQRRLTATLGYQGTRTSGAFTAFSVDRNGFTGTASLDSTLLAALRQQGLQLTVSHKLTPSDQLTATVQGTRSVALDSQVESRIRIGQLAYSTALSTRTTGSMLLRRTVQSSTAAGVSYAESAAIAILDTRF